MRELWKTMNWKQRRRYAAHVVWRNRRVLAYLLVAGACIYAVLGVRNEATQRTNQLAAQRSVRADEFLRTLGEGSVQGCITANSNTQAVRKIVVNSYKAGIPSIRKLVQEGTLSDTQAKRILADSRKQTQSSLNDLQYRDCALVAERYIKEIDDPNTRREARQNASVDSQAALIDREHAEPHLPPLPSN